MWIPIEDKAVFKMPVGLNIVIQAYIRKRKDVHKGATISVISRYWRFMGTPKASQSDVRKPTSKQIKVVDVASPKERPRASRYGSQKKRR